jgi:hypothetical protein
LNKPWTAEDDRRLLAAVVLFLGPSPLSFEERLAPRRKLSGKKIFAQPLKPKFCFFIFQSPSQDGFRAPDGPGKSETGTGRVRCRL